MTNKKDKYRGPSRSNGALRKTDEDGQPQVLRLPFNSLRSLRVAQDDKQKKKQIPPLRCGMTSKRGEIRGF